MSPTPADDEHLSTAGAAPPTLNAIGQSADSEAQITPVGVVPPWGVTIPYRDKPSLPPVRRLTTGASAKRFILHGIGTTGGRIGAAALVLVGLAGLISILPTAPNPLTDKHTLTGTVNILGGYDGCGMSGASATRVADRMQTLTMASAVPCPDGPGGAYGDLRDGTAVSISDGAGQLLGTGQLVSGSLALNGVTFEFRITDVPERDFYTVKVANRGELPYSLSQLVDKGWQVDASIG